MESRQPTEIFTPEDFTDEHRAIGDTTDEFWNKEVAPHLEAIQHQDHDLAVQHPAESRRNWDCRR